MLENTRERKKPNIKQEEGGIIGATRRGIKKGILLHNLQLASSFTFIISHAYLLQMLFNHTSAEATSVKASLPFKRKAPHRGNNAPKVLSQRRWWDLFMRSLSSPDLRKLLIKLVPYMGTKAPENERNDKYGDGKWRLAEKISKSFLEEKARQFTENIHVDAIFGTKEGLSRQALVNRYQKVFEKLQIIKKIHQQHCLTLVALKEAINSMPNKVFDNVVHTCKC